MAMLVEMHFTLDNDNENLSDKPNISQLMNKLCKTPPDLPRLTQAMAVWQYGWYGFMIIYFTRWATLSVIKLERQEMGWVHRYAVF